MNKQILTKRLITFLTISLFFIISYILFESVIEGNRYPTRQNARIGDNRFSSTGVDISINTVDVNLQNKLSNPPFQNPKL